MRKLFLLLLLLPLFFLVSQTGFAQGNQRSNREVCERGQDELRCHSRVITDQNGKPTTTQTPTGLGPAQFRGAYLASASATVSTNQTIAIVDAYDHPRILSDLNTYSAQFGIPGLASCPVSAGTTSSPCFQKVDQNGGSSYPRTNSKWALEIALDVEAAHALCQNCNILLVEAKSASYGDLMAAVDRAVAMGAKVVSNSYGSNEFSSETQIDSHFNKAGVAFTFSSGDSGYGTSYPAASQYVTAVGGTTLNMNGNSYVSESVWSGAGSGCSLYESKPSWQTDTGCSNRTIADVSADADPNTGAAVYDSVSYFGYKGWFTVGGTSLASPLVAAVYALGGVPAGSSPSSLPYANVSALRDITSGSNGTCNPTYLCTGTAGYDGPTGLGSPNGTAAF